MSPEQARGKPADRRADLWAVGCLLYEMLAGRRAFPGDTASDSLVAVLSREPDWEAIPKGVPAPLVQLLRRCLEKDAGRRLGDAVAARREIEAAQGARGATGPGGGKAWGGRAPPGPPGLGRAPRPARAPADRPRAPAPPARPQRHPA